MKPFSRNAKIFPTYSNGFAYQNGTALIGQLNPAKRFYIFTNLTSLHDLAKYPDWGRVYKSYIRKMIVNRVYQQKLHFFVSFDLTPS